MSAGPGGIASPNNPGIEDLEFNPAFGAFFGIGPGIWLSNAQCPADLEKTQRTVTFNTGEQIGPSIGIALSYGEGIWHLFIAVEGGYNPGLLELSFQNTKTITTKNW